MSKTGAFYIEQMQRQEEESIPRLDEMFLNSFLEQINKSKMEGIWKMKEHTNGEVQEISFDNFCHGLEAVQVAA